MRLNRHQGGCVAMMSSTVPVGTHSLLPLLFLSPPASLCLSTSVIIVRKPGSGRKEDRQTREENREEEVDQLYTNQDFFSRLFPQHPSIYGSRYISLWGVIFGIALRPLGPTVL